MIRMRWNSVSNSLRPCPERSRGYASTKGHRIPARILAICGARTGRCSQARPSPTKRRAAGSKSTSRPRFQIHAGTTYIASYHTNVGEYSATDFYFDTPGFTNGALTASGNGLNGVYAYGAGPIFPNNVSIANGSNYWVDVVFDDTSQNPQAQNDGGFVVTEDGTLLISGSELLANDSDPNGLPFSISSVSNSSLGTVSYNSSADTVTFTPAVGYAGPATFNYTISDTSGATGTGQVSVNVNYPASAQSLFGTAETPNTVTVNDTNSVELGMKFTASVSGEITGIRFYKGPQNTGAHIGDLWSSDGTLLASTTFTNETASGWQQANFSQPVFVTTGTTYVVSYHTNGDYSANSNFFANPLSNGDITAPSNAGVYAYGSGIAFPMNTFNGSNYWVDVVFDDTSQNPQAQNDGGFVVTEDGTLLISGSELLANDSDPNGLPFSISSVSNSSLGTVSYNSSADTVTFTPAVGYAGPATFNYTISDTSGATGTGQVSVNVNYPASAQSLFGTAETPNTVTVNDTNSVELGMKFTASVSGEITGIRFYKGPQNTGAHIGDLWSSDGTLLASTTFTNETASGWQQANFSQPVFVTTGTTYVVSYHTNGDYSANSNFFANPLSNGDITAPSNAGVYAYGSGIAFPMNTFNGSNYWVDVVFDASTLQPPVAQNDGVFSGAENGTISISASALLANDSDPNGLPLSISGVSDPTHGTVTYDSNTQTVSFVPTVNYVGSASFTYTVTDGQGAASANVSLAVSGLAPLARDDNGFVTNENSTLSVSPRRFLPTTPIPVGCRCRSLG